MNVLQLASQYTVSPVYKELFEHINKNDGFIQTIFLATRRGCVIDKYKLAENERLHFVMRYTHGKLSRALYYPRIVRVYLSIKKSVNLYDFDIIHAHTLFADGGVAWIINKICKKDYIVTVRSTDLTAYMKKMRHVRLFMPKIVRCAKKVVFISPGMYKELRGLLKPKDRAILDSKYVIIPNGISEHWHDRKNKKCSIKNRGKRKSKIVFLQICEQLKRKNVDKSILAIKELNKEGVESSLVVVGEGKYLGENKKFAEKMGMDKYVDFCGGIDDIDKIRKKYDEADIFIMPSINETFGLVYAEAMSQGLPIIYTIDTGIYGYIKEGRVGFGVDPNSISDIVSKAKMIINDYSTISANAIVESRQFDWNSISDRYCKEYKR